MRIAFIEFGQRQQILHQSVKPHGLRSDILTPFADSAVQFHGIRIGKDDCQRRLDLMPRIRNKLFLLFQVDCNGANRLFGEEDDQQEHE